MDQNLEPKVDPPKIKIKTKRLKLEKSDIYLMGATSPRSFVGYIKHGAWTEEQIQEYIEVQKRLAPDCVKERERASKTPANDEYTKVEGSTAKTGKRCNTVAQADKKRDNTDAKVSRTKSPLLLEVIPETDDEE